MPTEQGVKLQIKTTDAPPPGGSYSQAIRCNGMIFVSGQTPRDLERNIVSGPFSEQARKTLENLRTVVEAAGGTLADAVAVTVYLSDFSFFDEMDAVYREFFPEPRPARTTIQSNIPVPIEIDATLFESE